MNKKVVIIGASGHGKVIADIIIKSGDCVKGFLDDAESLPERILDIPVLGKVPDFEKFTDCRFVIAIGNAAIRERIADSLDGRVQWYTAVHPGAAISSLGVEIGEGTVIMANAVVNSGAHIGRHCIVNTAAVVEHDNALADYVHISPGAVLAGTVTVGKRTHIGVGACVRNNLSICADCVIGAGAAVVKDVIEPGAYVGVPARKNCAGKRIRQE